MANAQTRILTVIDCIASEALENAFPGIDYDTGTPKNIKDFSREDLEKHFEALLKAVGATARFAHIGMGVLSGENGHTHDDWINEFVKLEKQLIESESIPSPKEYEENYKEISLPE